MKFKPYKRKELKTLKMPVLVLIGDQDIINKKSIIEKANKFIPHAETWIIQDAGHFLSMDQSEITNSRILDFLNTQEVTSK
jgi:pimeloyl-ACP methyl ester carboxylesterase